VIVVDTNVIAYLFLGGEKTPQARAAWRKDPVWAAPILWRSEFCNVLAVYLRQGQLVLSDALELVAAAESLLSGSEYRVESGRVLSLVAVSPCSAYDCEFVALAQELGVSLVTSDRQVLEAFPPVAVALDSFSSK
jgi:predicted nucleic acid-binding protein